MERFLERMIPIWLMIHVGFITYQMLDTYAFNPATAGRDPDYTTSIFRAGQPAREASSHQNASGTPANLNTNLNRRTPLEVRLDQAMEDRRYSGDSFEDADSPDVGNFMISLVCRVRDLQHAFLLFFSLFVLDYPFVQQFKEEGEGIILWVVQIGQYAGIFTGVMFLFYLALLFVRSGLIGALFTPRGVLAASGVALFGGLGPSVLANLLGCG